MGDRGEPEIEVSSVQDAAQVAAVVKKSRVCISAVMYSEAGETVVQACAENGCDYVDCAAVPPLLKTWIKNYDQTARRNGVALIHGAGALALPMDVMVGAAARAIATRWGAKTRDVTFCLEELDTNLSSGTVRTILSQAALGPKVIQKAQEPSALSPINHTAGDVAKSGVYRDPVLGHLSNSSVSADQNRAFIYRSWGLLEGIDKGYGPNFTYNEYNRVNSTLAGVVLLLQFYAINFIIGLARFGPIRNYLLKHAPTPGAGPTDEIARSSKVGMELLAKPDITAPGKFVNMKFSWAGGHYPLTAMLMSQTAASLIYHRELEGGIKGGCLTPAILGNDLLERIGQAGAQVTTVFSD
ncbi:hypothetical protein SLS62_008064 [Diatrype stigma]|uniref:Saccharopine dehydrogenase NADP binding domain-containing protein n=1 Tax=Diatrype stigma TaxID=117547 RepID=A0AAN9ULS2_9PEZI